MPSPYLTKSDFKACLDCPTKLFYRKHEYPSANDENEYLQFLADGGFMVEHIAKAQFPHGIDLVDLRDPAAACAKTKELLEKDGAVVFEAGALFEKFYVRTDVLRREGPVLHLIEVKSKSLETEDDDVQSPFLTGKGKISARWAEYLFDVAFQAYVLQLAFPDLTVKPHLCVVNKSHPVAAHETLARFQLNKDRRQPRSRPQISYDGSASALLGSGLLTIRPVDQEVAMLLPEVKERAAKLAALLDGGKVVRAPAAPETQYRHCKGCEFRAVDKGRSGFGECWGALANGPFHILDLHRVSQIGTTAFPDPVPALLRSGSGSYLGLKPEQLGKPGSFQERRLIQWTHSQGGGSEHLPADLTGELVQHESNPGWPLHFIDFEACNVALPHHAGLRPYERVAFQWSCHTLRKDGALEHLEWINTQRVFPNFVFAASLRAAIGDSGTVYVWSPYEQTTLTRVLRQIAEWIARDPGEAVAVSGLKDLAALNDLAAWIEKLLGVDDGSGKRQSPRIRDLHDLARRHYFHPRMGGRTSIKVVLPAIWSANAALRDHVWFKAYARQDSHNQPMDPYATLPALPMGDGEDADEVVHEGTGAIRVYQDLLFETGASDQDRTNREQLLRQYCGLDTIAMLIVWTHWRYRPASP